MVHKKRVSKLKKRMDALGLDAFVTFNLKNVRYLTGFSGSSGAVAVFPKKAKFFTDFRYASQAKLQVSSAQRVIASSLVKAVSESLADNRAKRIGYEEGHLTAKQLRELKKTARGRWKPVSIVEELRLIKDAGEIRIMQKNFRLLERVFRSVGRIIVPGKREREAAAELEYRLRRGGAEKPAFDFIVASGRRSALPHGVASGKIIKKGEIVTLDWGAVLGGYHSDNTRAFFLGKPKPKLRKIFDVVLEANIRAIRKVKPGALLKEIDSAARDYIESKGYGKYFGHGTGHGVGLDIHEAPRVSPASKETAREGMVFTIEPGIYIPGIGGVRIEDMLAVTAKGCRVLSRRIPKEMAVY